MASKKLDLPAGLAVPEFWRSSSTGWKNITGYDFRYLVKTHNVNKADAHLAYTQDIQKLSAVVKQNTNLAQNLNVCKNVLKDVHKNKANAFFWETEAPKVIEISVEDMTAEQELQLITKLIAIDVLKERRRDRDNNNNDNRTNPPTNPTPPSIIESDSSSSSRSNVYDMRNSNNNSSSTDNSNSSSDETSAEYDHNTGNSVNNNISSKRKHVHNKNDRANKKQREDSLVQDFIAFKRNALNQASIGDGICNESYVHHLLYIVHFVVIDILS
ncbi:hypothetical protein BDC45DRAFT_207841 [Circinella umbellata]|nr:hypothetical protein BDC45DRAFT_207841 [Circinella umbellata]